VAGILYYLELKLRLCSCAVSCPRYRCTWYTLYYVVAPWRQWFSKFLCSLCKNLLLPRSSCRWLLHFAPTVLSYSPLPCSIVDRTLRLFSSEYSFRVISEHSPECLINLEIGILYFGF